MGSFVTQVYAIKNKDTKEVIQMLVTIPKNNELDIGYRDFVKISKVGIEVEEDDDAD